MITHRFSTIRIAVLAAFLGVSLPLVMGTAFLPEIDAEGYFTIEETTVLRDIAAAVSLKHGYSFDLELDYLTYANKNEADKKIDAARLFEAVDGSDIEVSKTLFLKLFRLYRQTECQVNRYSYKDLRSFRLFTTLYVTPIRQVTIALEDALCKKDIFLRNDFQPKKAAIEREESLNCFMTEDEGQFFNAADREILEATLQTIDYDHGYDTELYLAYLFSFTYSESITAPREKDFQKALARFDREKVLSFYEKVFKLLKITERKMEEHRVKKKWKFYTYISKKLMPPLQTYIALLEKSMAMTTPNVKTALAEKQGRVQQWIDREYKHKERIVETFDF